MPATVQCSYMICIKCKWSSGWSGDQSMCNWKTNLSYLGSLSHPCNDFRTYWAC